MFSDVNYTESSLVPFDTLPDTQCTNEYDYDSDSDLGYFSEDEVVDITKRFDEMLACGQSFHRSLS